jgi:Anti-sigma-K factor rskA
MDRRDSWAGRLDPELLGDGETLGAPDEFPVELPPEEEAALARLAETLADEAMWSGPPSGVREALLAAVTAEAAARPTVATRAAVRADPLLLARRSRRRRSVPRAGWWLSAAAAAVLVVGGVLVLRPDNKGPAASFTAAGTSNGRAATAVVALTPKPGGVAIRLLIKGLPPAPTGSYYAAWVRGPEGTVGVGTFHWHVGGHPIDLWSGVDFKRYPELFVTLQKEGAPPLPSQDTVLDGTLTPS